MAADVATALKTWSTDPASNAPAGTVVIGTNLDDNLREIQAVVRDLASPNTIAAAASMDLGAVDETFLTTTSASQQTITAFGTVSAGIYKFLIFDRNHILTHNATSLILPGAANITCAEKDTGLFVSLGSGNWRCLSYTRASGAPVATTLAGLTLTGAALTTATITSPTIVGTTTEDYYSASSPFTLDLANGSIQRCTTIGNATITLPTATAGKRLTVVVVYGGPDTVTWSAASGILWPGGAAPTATSVAGKYDVYHFFGTGTWVGQDGGRNLS